jgi:hypothetical protein
MAAFDFKDFYILYQGHPKYESSEIIEDEVVRVIVQKCEMMLFTNKGEVLGEPDFGASLPELVFQTKVSDITVKSLISEQITRFIPELAQANYYLDIIFVQDPTSFQDIMFINLKFGETEIYAQIGKFNSTQ